MIDSLGLKIEPHLFVIALIEYANAGVKNMDGVENDSIYSLHGERAIKWT